MFPDRLTAPAFKTIEGFDLPVLSKHVLSNGIPLYYYNGGSSEVLKLEIFLENGGQSSEFIPAQSSLAIRMLTEGTTSRTSEQIQEEIARSGGFIELNPGSDRSSIVLYSLTRQLPNLLPVVIDLISHSTYPEKELENLRNISIQGLKVNLEKTGYLASSTFRELIFGKGHPYGFNLSLESLEKVSREDLISFYSKFKTGNFTVFLSGKFDDSLVNTLQNYLEKISTQAQKEPQPSAISAALPGKRVIVEKAGNMQCSLRVGRKLFTSAHPDYFSFVMMNEILGGYFGSRLMQNLREEKGLTYGVHSNVVGYKTDGYFVIGTDIKKSDAPQALDEIQKEIKRMQEEPVSEEELQTVKNYMLGSFVNTLTTPFAIVDKSKSILLNNLPDNFYEQYFSAVKNATPQQLMDVATQYLKPENMVEVVGGSLE